MDKITDSFIKNAGKSTEKPVIEYNAFTSKPERPGDRFNISWGDFFFVVGISSACAFILYLNFEGLI